jgi:hypothetical protein
MRKNLASLYMKIASTFGPEAKKEKKRIGDEKKGRRSCSARGKNILHRLK